MREFFFKDKQEAIDHLSSRLLEQATLIQQDTKAVLALSGGSTPAPLYTKLADKFNWHDIWLTPTDERCVDESDPKLNANMIQQTLLNGRPSEKFISLLATPEQIFSDLNLYLHTVLLGMGEDGHIASLFPPFLPSHTTQLIVNGKAPDVPHDRLSISFEHLINAKNIFLFFTGATKKEIYEEAKKGVTATLPISSLLKECGEKLHVYSA